MKELPYDGPGGMYSAGSPDGSRPGVFYANVRRPADKYVAYTILRILNNVIAKDKKLQKVQGINK